MTRRELERLITVREMLSLRSALGRDIGTAVLSELIEEAEAEHAIEDAYYDSPINLEENHGAH